MRWVVLSVLFAGCSFSGASVESSGDPDAAPGDDIDSSSVDAAVGPRCAFTKVDVCPDTPEPAIEILGAEIINTDTDPRCITKSQAGGPDLCVIYAEAITVSVGGTLIAIGSRPLALVSVGAVAIDGTIDASSRRGETPGAGADFTGCMVERAPENDNGGAAGAAGGSFNSAGGQGGRGDTDNSIGNDNMAEPGLPGMAVTATTIRGGCPGDQGGSAPSAGSGGVGGSGGGGVYVASAESIAIGASGAVRVTGAGGDGGREQAGGGGGGSGGHACFEADEITNDGFVAANGGGGGEGGNRFNGNEVIGNPGIDGQVSTMAAGGGQDALGSAGHGGDGSSQAAGPENGQQSIVGAGGGGGGAGQIEFIGTLGGAGQTSPTP